MFRFSNYITASHSELYTVNALYNFATSRPHAYYSTLIFKEVLIIRCIRPAEYLGVLKNVV